MGSCRQGLIVAMASLMLSFGATAEELPTGLNLSFGAFAAHSSYEAQRDALSVTARFGDYPWSGVLSFDAQNPQRPQGIGVEYAPGKALRLRGEILDPESRNLRVNIWLAF